MKKRYFLALAASVVCGMSVEAQVPVSKAAMPTHGISLVGNEKAPAAPEKSFSMLRSDDGNALPDSAVRVIDGENYLKFVYDYTDEGKTSLLTAILWNADASSWASEKYYSEAYTYDENGNRIRTVRENVLADGSISTETTINEYDDQGRLTSTYFVSAGQHMLETYNYEGDSICHYSANDSTFIDGAFDSWTLDRQIYTLDEAGNIVNYVFLDFDEWLGDETHWYQYAGQEVEYDSLNRMTTVHYFWMNDEGVVEFTRDITYTYLDDTDDSYIAEQVETDNGVTTYYAAKYEWVGDNPTTFTGSEKNSEDADWTTVVNYTDTYYYPTTVSNATISDNAEPTFKAYAADGSLVITTTGARAVQVYGIAGACHYNATVNGSATISNLPAGIYVIASEGETMKISVR